MRHVSVAVVCALLAVAIAAPATAQQDDSLRGAEHIMRMAGCFSVLYRFYEDGEHDAFSPDYGLDEPVRELVEVASKGLRSITLANYAILPDGRKLPHWHQEWTYQAERQLWRQTVWSSEPASSSREFRYSCDAAWRANTWSCDAGPAPKPFRDDGAPFGFLREDYARLDRDNRLLVTEEGWVHSEFNRKLTEAGDLVAYEIGLIVYERISDAACEPSEPESPAD